MKIRILSAVMAAAFLAGCQTQTVEEMSFTQRKQLAEVIKQRCYAQGVTEKSGEFGWCIKTETEGEIARRQRASAREDMAAAQPRITVQPQPQQVTCTRWAYTGDITCR
ncbi:MULTISPECIES: hypothetical protein [unclassified Ensifer]|uniref:hypothetical protein n=1 Tax=unclassified Ensifer TaxID=2633371 RepID=UPI000813934A|nr:MULTISPECIES: hypothetical protein [unclassified Ensifer]OCP12408.1 hypothetical protein BBX50_16590 [Ensifer sp. LC11]